MQPQSSLRTWYTSSIVDIRTIHRDLPPIFFLQKHTETIYSNLLACMWHLCSCGVIVVLPNMGSAAKCPLPTQPVAIKSWGQRFNSGRTSQVASLLWGHRRCSLQPPWEPVSKTRHLPDTYVRTKNLHMYMYSYSPLLTSGIIHIFNLADKW